MRDKLDNKLIKENLEIGESEKIDWIACGAWVIRELFNKGLMKGFDKEDFQILKLVNKAYNRAKDNKKDGFTFYMFGDIYADKLSDKGFKKLKETYEKNKSFIN